MMSTFLAVTPDWINIVLLGISSLLIMLLLLSVILGWMVVKRTNELHTCDASKQALLKSIPGLLFHMDRTGTFINYQATEEHLLYMQPEHFLGKKIDELMPPELAKAALHNISRALKNNQIFTLEYQLPIENKVHHFEVHFIPETKNEVLAIVHDITERKCAEAEIKAHVAFLDTVMEQSPFAMWISDIEGTIIKTNNALRHILNLTDIQIVGKYNVLKDENLLEQGVMPLIKAVFEEKISTKFTIYWSGAKAGNEALEEASNLWIYVSMFPILDEDRALSNVVCQWVDITERVQAEEALRESEKEYRELIDGMSETVWLVDFYGNLIDVNNSAVEVLGYSKDELISLGLYGIDSSLSEDEIKALAHRMPSDKLQVYETSHKTKDGRSFPVEVSSSLVTYQGNRVILSIARDITERKRAEEEHQHLLEQVIQDANELEKRVQERTEQYQSIIDLTADREIRMAELKQIIEKLRDQIKDAGMTPIADDPLLGKLDV